MKLPESITMTEDQFDDDIFEEISEYVSDYLSNKYGFCHEGFEITMNIQVSNIKWDISED